MADFYILDKGEELNKRIDDAFTELDAQRNRISELTRENSELKNELIRLQEVQELKSLILRTILGIMGFFGLCKLYLISIYQNEISLIKGKMKMAELNPCPICKSKVTITKTYDGYIPHCTHSMCVLSNFLMRPRVTEDEAIMAWNRKGETNVDR